MKLQSGEIAPIIETQDFLGNPVRLSDFRGKWVLLSFLRNGACALCNLRVHELIQNYPRLRASNIAVITVFESPASSIAQYVGNQQPPFPIVPDPSAELYNLYGLESSEEVINQTMQMPATQQRIQAAAANGFELTPEKGSNFLRVPADFLIDPKGVIRETHYLAHLTDHLPLEKVFALASAAQAA